MDLCSPAAATCSVAAPKNGSMGDCSNSIPLLPFSCQFECPCSPALCFRLMNYTTCSLVNGIPTLSAGVCMHLTRTPTRLPTKDTGPCTQTRVRTQARAGTHRQKDRDARARTNRSTRYSAASRELAVRNGACFCAAVPTPSPTLPPTLLPSPPPTTTVPTESYAGRRCGLLAALTDRTDLGTDCTHHPPPTWHARDT